MYLHAKIILVVIALAILTGGYYLITSLFDDAELENKEDKTVVTTAVSTVDKTDNSRQDGGKTDKSDNADTTNNVLDNTPVTKENNKVAESAMLIDAEKLLADNKPVAARDKLWKYLVDKSITEEDEIFWKIGDLLRKVNLKIYYGEYDCPEFKTHEVVSGDSLSKIAKTHNTTVKAIQSQNGMDEDDSRINLGQTIIVYPTNFRIKVIKSKYRMILFDNDKIFATYKIAIGKNDRTPEASFTIDDKREKPDWLGIPYGDPRNSLGTRWLRLTANDATRRLSGYGIHGTWEPESIGTKASQGCIRMLNSDVEELFELVPTPYTSSKTQHIKVDIVK